jgi:hypothetical protein
VLFFPAGAICAAFFANNMNVNVESVYRHHTAVKITDKNPLK